MIDTDVLDSTPRAYIGKVQGNPMGDDVTSGQKAPLGRILHNFWLCMRAPKGTPFGTSNGTLGHFRYPWYLYYCTVLYYTKLFWLRMRT